MLERGILLFLIGFFLFGPQARAEFDFDDLTQDDIDGLNRDFSALFAHTTVSPAGGLIVDKAFEFGLVAGTSTVPNVVAALRREDPENDISRIPNVGLIGLYSYTTRLTFEAKWIPDLDFSDVALGSQSLAAKLTLPGRASIQGVRVHVTNSYVRTSQEINNDSTGNMPVSARSQISSLSLGATFLAGIKVLLFESMILEPYVGVGGIFSKTTYKIKGSSGASVLLSGESSVSSSEQGLMGVLGAQIHWYFSKFGFEYSRVYDSDRVTLKISFGY